MRKGAAQNVWARTMPVERIGQAAPEQPAEERVGTHQVDQQDPAHQGRQRQGQQHHQSDQRGQAALRTGQKVGQGDTEQRDQRQRDGGGLERDEEGREQSRHVEAPAGRAEEAVREGDERDRQVDDDEAAQPGKGAAQRPPGHRESCFFRSLGTEDLPLTLGGLIATTPFFSRIRLPVLAEEEGHEGAGGRFVRRSVEHREV